MFKPKVKRKLSPVSRVAAHWARTFGRHIQGNMFFSPLALAASMQVLEKMAAGENQRAVQALLPKGLASIAIENSFFNFSGDHGFSSEQGIYTVVGLGLSANYQPVATNIQLAFVDWSNPVQAQQELQAALEGVLGGTLPKLCQNIPEGTEAMIHSEISLAKTTFFWPFQAMKLGTFCAEGCIPVDTPMLHYVGSLYLLEQKDFTVVLLPTLGLDLCLAIIVPNQLSLQELEAALQPEWLTSLEPKLTHQVHLSMPAFFLDLTTNFKPAACHLGLAGLFENNQPRFGGLTQHAALNLGQYGLASTRNPGVPHGQRLQLLPTEFETVVCIDRPFLFGLVGVKGPDLIPYLWGRFVHPDVR